MALVSSIYGNNAYNVKAVKAKNKKRKQKRFADFSFQYQQELIQRATPSEIAFQHILIDLRIQYEFQKVFGKNNKFRIVDFWLPQLKVVVEIDGGYHTSPIQGWKDSQRERSLLKQHRGKIKRIIRFTNDEVKDVELVKRRLNA
jgi:very-short-patch-repair endonuclease